MNLVDLPERHNTVDLPSCSEPLYQRNDLGASVYDAQKRLELGSILKIWEHENFDAEIKELLNFGTQPRMKRVCSDKQLCPFEGRPDRGQMI